MTLAYSVQMLANEIGMSTSFGHESNSASCANIHSNLGVILVV